MSKTFLILGGYGNTGILIADFLLKYTDAKLILAGRNIKKAENTAQRLNEKYFDDRVKPMRINVANKKNLSEKFLLSDMVIVASSTNVYLKNIIEASIDAGKDYLDIMLSSKEKLKILESFEQKILEKNLLFITDCGFHPGVPAILIRKAASKFDKLEIANVASLINLNWKDREFSKSTILEFADEFRHYKPLVFKNNKWTKLLYKDYKKFDFDNNIKRVKCAPMMLEELRKLPVKYPHLRETGFYVTGFNSMVNYFIIPVGMTALKISTRLFRKIFARSIEWGLKKFSKPPYRSILLVSAIGRQNEFTKEVRIKLTHSDGYWLTAASVTALLFQYLRGNFSQKGVCLQGLIAEPDTFLHDIQSLGVSVSYNN